MRKLDVFILTCAFVLVANVCYFEGKHSADKWYAKQPHTTIAGAGITWSAITSADGGTGAIVGESEPGKPIAWHHEKPMKDMIPKCIPK